LESESVRELGAHERSKEEPFAVFGKVLLFLEDVFAWNHQFYKTDNVTCQLSAFKACQDDTWFLRALDSDDGGLSDLVKLSGEGVKLCGEGLAFFYKLL
jgi:hypothetical protein